LISGNISAGDLPIRFYVANHKAECTGVARQMCYLLKNSVNGEWKNYHGEIEGFDYKEGYEYEILVRKQTIDNPPADAPSFNYVIVDVVKKTPTMIISENARERLDKKIYSILKIRTEKGLHSVVDVPDCYIEFDLTENKIFGKDGCNDIMGSIIINKNNILISELATTRMMCERVTIDKVFHQHLKKVNRYRIKSNKLKLYEGKRLLIEFILSEDKKN
jgi:heat shock protein HslJ